MKGYQIAASIGSVMLVALGGAMALTNPSRSDYEGFATARLSEYLKENACKKLPEELGEVWQQRCRAFGSAAIDTGRPQLQQLIASQTERHNFIVFSIYRTTLPSFGSTYEFETLGVLQQFYLYLAEEQ
ncbi:DUF4359 domain-containing protein [Lusitaniella coriacea LEGE 07157]|uniref:DUF4359 domain-containing protein n=1 Tax=Lusitaniella coriacea LEGE 07157 TaxID=945747 RepID=A0A8J7IT63_9CYAN|nr:DUF4359 domain-containing protein [Lusitaniella coriacea]MBE9115663.1 DUF4359 domain-containing protein [Lusitaniella coriacea LEGE 07157]